MTIQRFIEAAIEGGWNSNYELDTSQKPLVPNSAILNRKIEAMTLNEFHSIEVPYTAMFLDTESWKAVGTIEGWKGQVQRFYENAERTERVMPQGGKARIAHKQLPAWLYNMHRMIDALAEGRTREQFLETL